MKAALKLEKKCHAENCIVNSLWNSSIQELHKKYPQTKLVDICAPLLELVCLVFICSFYPYPTPTTQMCN